MGKDVFVAMWHLDVADSFEKKSLPQKLNDMSHMITTAYGELRRHTARMNIASPVFIFMAPEYAFFDRIDTTKPSRNFLPYTSGQKDQFVRRMKAVSNAVPRMIVVPGTVVWKRVRGWFSRRRGQSGHASQDEAFQSYNTAYVFHRGSARFIYDKRFDDGNVKNFTPGSKPALFELDGIKYGVEVCGDYTESRLQTDAGGNRVDIEIYISATNWHLFNNDEIDKIPVRKGGYLLHCDASKEARHVRARFGVWAINPGEGWHGSETQFFPVTPTTLGPESLIPSALPANLHADYRSIQLALKLNRNVTLQQLAVILRRSEAEVRQLIDTLVKHNAIAPDHRMFSDAAGIKLSAGGAGNASRIGELLPKPTVPDLHCFSIPLL